MTAVGSEDLIQLLTLTQEVQWLSLLPRHHVFSGKRTKVGVSVHPKLLSRPAMKLSERGQVVQSGDKTLLTHGGFLSPSELRQGDSVFTYSKYALYCPLLINCPLLISAPSDL